MKRLFSLFLLFFLFPFLSFAQEEIWGYHSLAGSEGGGMIFRLAPETRYVETIHKFGHGFKHHNYPNNPQFFENGNGKLYGTTVNRLTSAFKQDIYAFNPMTNEVEILMEIEGNSVISAIDSSFIYLSSSASGSTSVVAYDIYNDALIDLMNIPNTQGYNSSGQWYQFSDSIYYALFKNGGEFINGSLIEIDLVKNKSKLKKSFDQERNPVGSLKMHSNGQIYALLSRGGENNLGAIIKLDPKGDGYEVEFDFDEDIGGIPHGELFLASDSCFYGATTIPWQYIDGSFYKYDPYNDTVIAIYHYNHTSEKFLDHTFSGYFSQLSDHELIGILEHNTDNAKGKIFSLNLINYELNILADFGDKMISKPKGALHFLRDRFWGIVQEDTIKGKGGVFSFSPSSSQISFEKSFYLEYSTENGQNPNWMCQGENGNIYGMTRYGGKENKGIVFEIDFHTKVFTKKMDLADIGFDISPYAECFSMGPASIIGMSRVLVSKDDPYRYQYELSIFEYNYQHNTIRKLLLIDDEDFIYTKGLRLNSEGNIYFNRNNKFAEYNFHNNEISITELAESLEVRDIIEYLPSQYLGTSGTGGSEGWDWTYGMVFKWDRQNNTSEQLLDLKRVIPDANKPARPRNKLFYSKNGILYGDFITNEVKPSWEEPFVYDINNDSILENHPLETDFDTHSRCAVIEDHLGTYLLSNMVASGISIGHIGIYNAETDTQYYAKLEESPFYYYYEGDGDYETNAPFDFSVKVDILTVETMDGKHYWTGMEDAKWYNENNWYAKKLPLSSADVVVAKQALHFPIIDTLVLLGNLEIQDAAKLTVNPKGSLTCENLISQGSFIMLAEGNQKASFISELGTLQSGGFQYQYHSSKAQELYMGLPIYQTTWFDLDSIPAWGYYDDLEDMLYPIEDSAYTFERLKPYIFKLDSAQTINFKGTFNWGNYVNYFSSAKLNLLSNPYPSSIHFSKLDLSKLSHHAVYRYHEEEDYYSSYISGIGDASPLIRPLETFWVFSDLGEVLEFNNADRVHELHEELVTLAMDYLLVLEASGVGGRDKTFISFNENANADFEPNQDALKVPIYRNDRPQIFTFGGNAELAINQLPDTTMMDLALKSNTDGTYTISIDSNMGYDYLVLEDLIWNKRINLLEESYSFDYFSSDENYPFKLYFTDWVLQPLEEGDIEVYYYPESIVVRSRKMIKQADIIFYDLAGKAVLSYTENDFFKFEKAISLPTGHYIVQVRNANVVKNAKVLIRR